MVLFIPFPHLLPKNCFSNLMFIWSMASKTSFGKRKWNYFNRKWIYLTNFHLSDQKTILETLCLFDPWLIKQVLVQEKELSKQEMDLFKSLSISSFRNLMFIWWMASKTSFRNRKQNYQNRKCYFSQLQSKNFCSSLMFIWSKESE